MKQWEVIGPVIGPGYFSAFVCCGRGYAGSASGRLIYIDQARSSEEHLKVFR